MTITSPQSRSIFQHIGGVVTVIVSATASGVPTGGGVEFVLDQGESFERSGRVYSSPYEYIFTAVPLGEHTLHAYVINSAGNRISPPDFRERIGVGDIIVCMGDSITAGEYDDIDYDNWSADGRNGPYWDPQDKKWYGGYEPILNDLLTASRGYPHSVVNEGLPSESTDRNPDGTPGGAKVRVSQVICRNPTAKTWLIAYGTNDANEHMPASTFKANLQSIITQIHTAIPDARIYLPKVFYFREDDPQGDHLLIPGYHNAIGELTRTMSGVYWGADLETLFKGNHSLYNHTTGQPGTWFSPHGTHHPNGVGVQKMATLWKMALLDRAVLVGDGVVASFGSTNADKIRLDNANSIGLNASNLLQVCEVPKEQITPPDGMVVLGKLGYDLRLTGGGDFTSSLSVTMRVEAADLASAGATSWDQTWIGFDNIILPTTRMADPDFPSDKDLKASVSHRGRISALANVSNLSTICTSSPSRPDGENGWFITLPQIALTATGGIGAITIKYRWDSGSEIMYSGPFAALLGSHTLYYYAMDQYGNKEPTKSKVFKVDITPPLQPTISDGGKYCEPGRQLCVSWTASSDPESGLNKYKYAIGTTPGGTEILDWTSTKSTSFTWTPPSIGGITYYFSVMAKNLAGIYCAPTTDSITVPFEVPSLGMAKRMADGLPILVRNVIVTASFDNMVYLEEPNRSAGIAVSCQSSPARGTSVAVAGLTRNQALEPMLLDAEFKNETLGEIPRSVGVPVRTLFWNISESGLGKGLSTFGLLMTVWGVVKHSGVGWMIVSDGSNPNGLYVICDRLTNVPPPGTWVAVTGVSTIAEHDGHWLPALRPRDQADVLIIRPA